MTAEWHTTMSTCAEHVAIVPQKGIGSRPLDPPVLDPVGSLSLHKASNNTPKIWEPTQNSRRQSNSTLTATNNMRHPTNFSRPGDLAPRICAPLSLGVTWSALAPTSPVCCQAFTFAHVTQTFFSYLAENTVRIHCEKPSS